jgi:hypothetical protein
MAAVVTQEMLTAKNMLEKAKDKIAQSKFSRHFWQFAVNFL